MGLNRRAAVIGLLGGVLLLVNSCASDVPSDLDKAFEDAASDSVAPSGFVSITSKSYYSSYAYVLLSATDSVGVTAYCLRNYSSTPSSTSSCWTSVTSTTSLSRSSVSVYVSSGSGYKYVYAWFRDAARNVSSRSYDSVYCYSYSKSCS